VLTYKGQGLAFLGKLDESRTIFEQTYVQNTNKYSFFTFKQGNDKIFKNGELIGITQELRTFYFR
jgi:hypothetical protein